MHANFIETWSLLSSLFLVLQPSVHCIPIRYAEYLIHFNVFHSMWKRNAKMVEKLTLNNFNECFQCTWIGKSNTLDLHQLLYSYEEVYENEWKYTLYWLEVKNSYSSTWTMFVLEEMFFVPWIFLYPPKINYMQKMHLTMLTRSKHIMPQLPLN